MNERQTHKYLETRNGIGDQEDKEDLERSGEKVLGQEGLERCGCRPMPPGGQKLKKETQDLWMNNKITGNVVGSS
jgi:hypothetical protein